jgi:hypothetical protein
MKRNKVLGALGVAAAALAIVAVAVPAAGAVGVSDADANRDLARARRATAGFHSVTAAESAGYMTSEECVSSPEGTMGVHYVNVDLITDGVLDAANPEALLYLPSGDATKLVAVEYIALDADQDAATDDDRPVLFGRGFEGPFQGNGPDEPVVYTLHAWIWRGNPSGILAAWNPSISCPTE